MDEKEARQLVSKVKRAASHAMRAGHTEEALSLICSCADLLYTVNLYYRDDDLEQMLRQLASAFLAKEAGEDDGAPFDQDAVVFWDGFGRDNRGLIQIYLKALCKAKHVIYVSYEDSKEDLISVQQIIEEGNGESCFIPRIRGDRQGSVRALASIVRRYRPKHFFFYSTPYDVVGTTVMYMFAGRMHRYQINLTDHAFWLGAGCIDTCIDFREYGAKITAEYRGIPKGNIVVIPFYPAFRPRAFQGFPFAVQTEQKVIFSGGALYKTLGDDNAYYSMVDRLLQDHPDAIFWYAGSGDSTEMEKLLKKYPNRAFLTSERKDLFETIQNCRLYLSTYPLCGGLMFQYAAMAGRVPVTLKRDSVADDFLIHQSDLGIEFDSLNDLYAEVDKLIRDEAYWQQRAQEMKASVISPAVFEAEVTKLFLPDACSAYPSDFDHIDTASFRKWRISTVKRGNLWQLLVRKKTTKGALRYYPVAFIGGVVSKVWQKLMGKAHAV